MLKMKPFIISCFLLLIIMTSCSVKPKKINYGNDHCYNCDMTAVDKTHASEYVTKKGKVYIFDAVECMVGQINKEKNEDLLKFILVSDFSNPGKLIDAKSATYLISEKIKSPMGANLSAFSSKKDAEKIQQKNGGDLYSWKTLKIKLSN